jgi:ABC-type polysaccharide/polyol phosphate transport system ATPase subunit
MSDNALIVRNLGKKFKLYNSPKDRLRDWISRNPKFHKEFWALKDINFEVKKGEFFGILGHNGAGKSTLLKIISGILVPTLGEFETDGKMLSIFGLSLGNSDRLTGRENILNRAKILGFPINFIEEKMNEIIEFSELGEFIDYPVGNYSSGMKSRLNFSMYALLDADLLVLDEVLAVGDIFFKQKCYQRMSELNDKGTSIILVTHSIASIRQYCSHVMVLDRGEQIFIGDTKEAIRIYTQMNRKYNLGEKLGIQQESSNESSIKSMERKWYGIEFKSPETEEHPLLKLPINKEFASLIEVSIYNESNMPSTVFGQGESISIYYSFEINLKIDNPYGGIAITDIYGNIIHSKTSFQFDSIAPSTLWPGDIIKFSHQVKLDIQTQTYFLGFRLGSYNGAHEEILYGLNNAVNIDVIYSPLSGRSNKFSGLCDLPSSCKIKWQTINN